MTYKVIVFGDLEMFLEKDPSGKRKTQYAMDRYAPVKDVMESIGIPHTEAGRININKRSDTDFFYVPCPGDLVQIYPPQPPVDVTIPDLLHPCPLDRIAFLADVNVGKLARLLRIAGFDTAGNNHLSDRQIAHIAEQERRIVLSKDRDLLKRKNITHGRLVRSVQPWDQLIETISFFGLWKRMSPFTICPVCNGRLERVEKEKIRDQLEPLTRLFHDTFRQCSQCGKIYWRGSHQKRFYDQIDKYFKKSDLGG